MFIFFPSLSLSPLFFLRTNAKLNIGLDLTGFGVPHSCRFIACDAACVTLVIVCSCFPQRCAYFRHMFPSHFLSKCSWFSVFIPTIPVLLLLFFPTVITLVCSNCEFSRRRRRHLSVIVIEQAIRRCCNLATSSLLLFCGCVCVRACLYHL